MSAGDPAPELIDAYLHTAYRVDFPDGTATIRVGEPCPELDCRLDRWACGQWAFISAVNPLSRPLPHAENRDRHAALRQLLAASEWRFVPGAGVADAGDWSEAGFLIAGIEEQAAISIGRRFSQNAILHGKRGGPAQLVWCRPDGIRNLCPEG